MARGTLRQRMKAAGLLTSLACGSFATFGQAQEPDAAANARPLVSIKEVMEKTITPVTNVLWNAFEPPTDEQWAALEEAAVTLLVAANAIAVGGTGPMDAGWVKQPAWQAFDRLMIVAGTMHSRQSARGTSPRS